MALGVAARKTAPQQVTPHQGQAPIEVEGCIVADALASNRIKAPGVMVIVALIAVAFGLGLYLAYPLVMGGELHLL